MIFQIEEFPFFQELPLYYEIIEDPIDFKTIKKRITVRILDFKGSASKVATFCVNNKS